MEHELALLSPEKTILTYRLASVGSRITAHIIDVFVIIATIFVTGFVVSLVAGFGPGMGRLALTGFLIFVSMFPFAYFIALEALWNGQTIGKKALSIKVRMSDGTSITPLAAIGRNLLRIGDLLPGTYFVGILAIFTTPKAQRLGDLVADTVVVLEKRALPYFTPAPHTAGIHPLENQVGELKGMTLDEYNALRRYADRFPELATPIQQKLTEEVFLPIAARRGVPQVPNVHPIYLAEAVVMKYGRQHGLL